MPRTAGPLLAAAVVLLLLVPIATAAEPWLRSGFDPERTGAIPFQGPQTNDTAFQVHLPGTPVGETILVDGAAYIGTQDLGLREDLTTEALWRIDLATTEVTELLRFPEGSDPDFVSPERVIVEKDDDLVALEIPTGEELWRATVFPDDQALDDRDYSDLTLVDGTLYGGYAAEERVPNPTGPGYTTASRTLEGLMAMDASDGQLQWTWTRPRGPTVRDESQGTFLDPTEPTDPGERSVAGMALALDQARVYAYMQTDYTTCDGCLVDGTDMESHRRQYELWAIDRRDGSELWMRNDTMQGRDRVEAGGEAFEVDQLPWTGWSCCARPVATPSAVHIRLDAFEALNKADGSTVWQSPLGRTDQIQRQGSMGLGARDGALIAASPQTLYKMDALTGSLDWQKNDPTPDKKYGNQPVILDEDTIYASTTRNLCGYGAPGIEARSQVTGELRWAWHYQPSVGVEGCSTMTPNVAAYGPGVLVWGHKDGTVNVIGRAEASMGLPSIETERYPEPGETVPVKVAGVEPGALGPATRYRVFWGDGSVTGWQASRTFEHAYNASGDVTARIQAANAANQTSSRSVTFHVGQTEPNLIETAFARENQEMTFGILGIAIAATGGAIGVARRYRERSRLQDELDALEQGFEETRDSPSECEALLETRKGRARSLVLDGVLTEEQGAMVRDRAEELRRQLRTTALEDEFGFLPYTLVTKAREMLEDGRVSSLEAEAFLAALDEVEGISDDQKTVVRERIASWRGRDVGGGTP